MKRGYFGCHFFGNLKNIENEVKQFKADIELVEGSPADVPSTWGDISTIRELGYRPKVHYTRGIEQFVNWYKQYYGKLN